jgi:hypothetical protein
MHETRRKPGILFWIFWVIATVIGWSARRVLLEFPEIANFSSLYLASFFGNGLLIGLLHWLVLHRYLPARGWKGVRSGLVWIAVSGLGWMLAWSLNILFPTAIIFGADWGYSYISISLMAGGISSFISGGMQRYVLRSSVERAWLWLPVSMLSMIAGMYAFQSVPITLPTLAFAAGGLVHGLISANGLIYLFGQEEPDPISFHPSKSKPQHVTPDFR